VVIIMQIRSLIDPKKKERIRDAIERGDSSVLLPKKKKPETQKELRKPLRKWAITEPDSPSAAGMKPLAGRETVENARSILRFLGTRNQKDKDLTPLFEEILNKNNNDFSRSDLKDIVELLRKKNLLDSD